MRLRVIIITVMAWGFALQTAQAGVLGFGLPGGARVSRNIVSLHEKKWQHVVRQKLDDSCGSATLATILKYYFRDEIDEQEVIEYIINNTDKEKLKQRKGFSLLDLKKFAVSKGYEAVGYRVDLDYLRKLDKPVLIYLIINGYDHFAVLRGVGRNQVMLADPAAGNISLTLNTFQSFWQGIVFVLSKQGEEKISAPFLEVKAEDADISRGERFDWLLGSTIIPLLRVEGEF